MRHLRRFLFYSHDGLGLGHVRRTLAVAKALTELEHDTSIFLVTGADDVESLAVPPRVGILKLPGPHSTDQKVLAAAVEIFRPEVLLVEKHPFGPRGELGPALEIVRASGGRAVLGLPDVLDDPRAVDLEWRNRGIFDRIPQYYDRVLVYGQPDLLDPVDDCNFPVEVARITSYCGYIVSSPRPSPRAAVSLGPRAPRVLATAGDGEAGLPLLEAFVRAAARAGWKATVVAGAHCPPEQRAALRARANDAGVIFRHFVPGLPSEFSSLDALVCTGGYNTLAEAVASDVPTVCVPRVEPCRDQLLRARAFSSRGLVRLVEPKFLSPEVLRAEVEAGLAEDRTFARRRLDLGGDRRAAHHLFELAAQRPLRHQPEPHATELPLQLAVAATS